MLLQRTGLPKIVRELLVVAPALWWLVRYVREIARTRWIILGFALAGFATSVGIDALGSESSLSLFGEDGAKLLAVRRSLASFLPLGPFELCFERIDNDGAIACGVHTLADGERRGELALLPDAVAEARENQADLEARFPDLFQRPYVSMTRVLYSDHALT